MIKKITNSAVFPLVPSYTKEQDVDYDSILSYVNYLQGNGASILMTTAGTTQFHLLTSEEVLEINSLCAKSFVGTLIAGIKPLSLREAKKQIINHNERLAGRDACLS